jgi:hypothetical protein
MGILNKLKIIKSSLQKNSIKTLRIMFRLEYYKQVALKNKINIINIDEIIDFKDLEFNLVNIESKKGHTTRLELLYIIAIIKRKLNNDENFLEIGTFDGNSAMNISKNLKKNSILYTIDLPEEYHESLENQLEYDKTLIDFKGRKKKKHLNCSNVKQIYSDSTLFDFTSIKFKGVFIDGGHSYDIVKADSLNCIKNIDKFGFILWHDYDVVNDVGTLIHELAKQYPIKWIRDTRLCYLQL